MVKYSVVIVVHNGEKFIRKCIDSIFANKYDNFEIVIIDDGSDDNTYKIVKSFFDHKLRYYYQKQSGTGNARNYGVSMSKGDYIVFLDADDFLSNDFFVSIDKKMVNNDADFFIFKWQSFLENKEQLYFGKVYGENNIIGMQTYIWNKVISKKIADEISFPSNTIYEDVAYSAQGFLRAKNVLFLDRVLYYHRILKGSVINSVHLPSRRLDIIKGFDLLIDDLATYGNSLDKEDLYAYQALINNIILSHLKIIIKENYYFLESKSVEKKLLLHLKKYNYFFKKSMILNDKITLNKKILYLMIKFGMRGIVKKIVN